LASLRLGAGLLSVDEVCSLVQMILNNEFLGVLQHFTREFQVTEEAIGLEGILEAGPGGHFVEKLHTLRHFREEQ